MLDRATKEACQNALKRFGGFWNMTGHSLFGGPEEYNGPLIPKLHSLLDEAKGAAALLRQRASLLANNPNAVAIPEQVIKTLKAIEEAAIAIKGAAERHKE